MANFIYYNPNPVNQKVDDCVVRAIAAATRQDWDSVYIGLVFQGFIIKDMPANNYVWGNYLRSKGFIRRIIPNTCPDCYTVENFADDHPIGTFVLGTGSHAVAVIDGDVYDTEDSRKEIPIYYYKEDK